MKATTKTTASLPKLNMAVVACFVLLISASSSSAFDAKKAEKSFRKCAACHTIGSEPKQKVGPQLNGLLNREAGAYEGFKYSNSMKRAGHDGLVWTKETLSKFLKKPRAFIKGTRMSYSGLKRNEERENLTKWLLSFNSDGKSSGGAGPEKVTLLGASAAALVGDPEYGEYLSGECVTCHQLNGASDGIPAVIGWPKEEFIHALFEYKQDIRKNPVMQTVSKRLGDEEMAALAAYFQSIEN